jgi:hypothetical protein
MEDFCRTGSFASEIVGISLAFKVPRKTSKTK